MTSQDRVRNMMREAVKTLGWNDQLTIADELMRMERIRHLPVLDEEGALVGIVSQRDLFRGALARALGYGEHAQEDRGQGLTRNSGAMDRSVAVRVISEASRQLVERLHHVVCQVVHLPIHERVACSGQDGGRSLVRVGLEHLDIRAPRQEALE